MPVVVDAPARRPRSAGLSDDERQHARRRHRRFGLARRLRRTTKPPLPLRISTPAHVASNFEGLVHRLDGDACGNWCACSTIRRRGPNPACGTSRPAAGLAPTRTEATRCPTSGSSTTSIADPIEANNRWHDIDDDPAIADVFDRMRSVLNAERTRAVPERNHPWPYDVTPTHSRTDDQDTTPRRSRCFAKLVQKLGMHPTIPRPPVSTSPANVRLSSRPTLRGSTSQSRPVCSPVR